MSLLECRNKIAHGEYDIPGKQTFLELFDDIVGLISHFKDDIQNLCVTEGFKKIGQYETSMWQLLPSVIYGLR